jgi:hypothetical protein
LFEFFIEYLVGKHISVRNIERAIADSLGVIFASLQLVDHFLVTEHLSPAFGYHLYLALVTEAFLAHLFP